MTSQNFETALEEYLNTTIEAEKEEYHSNIKPFSSFQEEIRSKLGDSLRSFQENYANGYQALLEEIRHEIEASETKEDLLTIAVADPEKLKIFDDSEALMKAFEEGSSIYELLGFTEKLLNVFYHAACRLMEAKEFKKAESAFYFLVTIAPEIYPFWLGLGQCYKNLGERQTALQVLLHVISMDPTQATAYLDIIDFFVEAHDFNKAREFCAASLQLALNSQKESWAVHLRAAIEEKRNSF